MLMDNRHAHTEFPPLTDQDFQHFIAAPKVILGFVDIHKCWRAVSRVNCRALLGCLGNKSDQKAAKNLRSFLLEKILRGTDEDDTSPVHGLKQITLILWMSEHTRKSAV